VRLRYKDLSILADSNASVIPILQLPALDWLQRHAVLQLPMRTLAQHLQQHLQEQQALQLALLQGLRKVPRRQPADMAHVP
jgi:hypothetical protein